jgi:glycosyltransferase involved in cell wall biosynthesis
MTGAQPLLSIITVTYNAGKVLQRTLDSVTAQDYPHIEHVLIDGASKDNTLALLQAHAVLLPASVLVSEPDRGLYDAMNKGLALAKGDYVLFLNAGDELADSHILTEIFASEAGAEVYYGHALMVDLDGRPHGLREPLPPKRLHWRSLKRGMNVSHQAFIVKRSLALEYDLSYRICADIDWMIRILKEVKSPKYVDAVFCRYLIEGLSSSRRKQAWTERYAVLRKHYGFWSNLFNHLYIAARFTRKKN